MKPAQPNFRDFARLKQQGITLVELMISMVIALILAGAVLLTYSSTRISYIFSSNAAQLQESGRFAIHYLTEDVRLSGYMGNNVWPADIEVLADVAGQDLGCGAGFLANFEAEFRVLNNPTDGQLPDCIHADNHLDGSDIIVTRHAGAPLASVNEIRALNVYMNAGVFDAKIFRADANDQIDTAAVFTASPPPVVYPFVAYVYFVRPCSDPSASGDASRCDAQDDSIPTLVRLTPFNGGMRAEPIAENIEDLQVIVGEDTDNDDAIDRLRLAHTVVDWDNVHSVEISLLVRAPNQEANYQENLHGPLNPVNGVKGSYTYGGKTVNKTDAFRRRIFTSTVFLRNDPSENTYG